MRRTEQGSSFNDLFHGNEMTDLKSGHAIKHNRGHMKKVTLSAAVKHIESHGILLVYPINNRKDIPSLWSCFFPSSRMRWEWDESGDNRVSDLWHLRQELSRSGKVVYAKWYQGRATFFSRSVFTALLSWFGSPVVPEGAFSSEARQILEVLSMDSPLSTKELKRATDLRGRALEPLYQKALKELWSRLLIVGYGEVEDGAFPSLAIGSTQLLFEDLWHESISLTREEAGGIIHRSLPTQSPFFKRIRDKSLQPAEKRCY